MRQLYTRRGSRVFLDSAESRLQHGDPRTAPNNVFVVVTGGAAGLVYRSTCDKLNGIVLTAGAASSAVRLEEFTPSARGAWSFVPSVEKSVGMLCDGYYLCGELDSNVTLSRKAIGEWEQFLLQPFEGFENIPTRQRVGLMSLPNGYFLFDAERDVAVGVTWPAVSGGGFIHSKSLPDGAWAVDAFRTTTKTAERFELYWLYPFSSRVHYWTLDEHGHHLDGRDLSPEDAQDFLFQRLDEGPTYLTRLFLLLAEKGSMQDQNGLPSQIASLALQSGAEEAMYAVCMHPRYFRPDIVDDSMAAARLRLRLARSVYPPSLSAGDWNARLEAFASVTAQSASPRRFDLDHEIGLGRDLRIVHEAARQHGNPPFLPRSDHLIVHQLTSDEMGKICHPIRDADLVFRMEFCSSGVIPAVVSRARSSGMLHDRLLRSVGYMHMILRAQMGRPEFIAHGAAYDIAPDERRAFLFQAWDGPCETERHSVSFERSVGNQHVTLVPDIYYLDSDGYREVGNAARLDQTSWTARRPAFIWRGSTTGFYIDQSNLNALPRYRLCKIGQSLGPAFDVGITDVVQVKEGLREEIRERLRQEDLLKPYVPQTSMGKYRYVIDIDGNANSWGFLAKLMLGSCVLKVGSRFEQWFYPDLTPWKHFIPLAEDLSDLPQIYEWCMSHPEMSEEIALSGQDFSLRMSYHEEGRKCAYEILRTSETIRVDLGS